MVRYQKIKAVLCLAGLGLLGYGIFQMQTDPTLRVLKTVSVAELEGTAVLPEDQYIAVNDAYLMGPYLISTSHSRKRGDSAYVFAPLASVAMIRQFDAGKNVKPSLWVRMATDYKTSQAAEDAMHNKSLYQQPFHVTGLVRDLEGSVKEKMREIGKLQIDAPIALHDGSTPFSPGLASAMVCVGILIWTTVALWFWSDLVAQKWAQSLQEKSGGQVFLGNSAKALAAVLGALVLWVAGGLAAVQWSDAKSFSAMGVLVALLGGCALVWGLLKSRSAAILTPEVLEVQHGKNHTRVPLTQVTGLAIDERKVKGTTVATYTLYRHEGKPFKVGSGLFKGGIDEASSLGLALRNQLLPLLTPSIMNQLESGQSVSFGPLSLSHQGISKSKNSSEVLPWSAIASSEVKKGELKIKQSGKLFTWGSFAVKKLLNLDVLMLVLEKKAV
jgi:hypothetical protein